MIGILRWFLGWSEFKIEGDSSYFLTKFSKNIWMVRKYKKNIVAKCLSKDYEFLKKNALKFSCILTLYKKVGFLNFLKKYKLRFGFLVGLILFFLIMLVSSLFVWNVEVFGNAKITDEQIFKICDANGLHFGSFVFNVNESDLEYKIKEKFPEISWISINRIAGKYIIEISESKQKPNISNLKGPCNVISEFDGEILYVEAYSGTPLVDVGDFVEKGQILVSGIQETKEMEGVIYTPSDAKILAKVKHYNENSIKKNSIIKQKIGLQKKDLQLNVFGLKLPLKINKKDNLIKNSEILKPLEFLGLRFPILVKTIIYDVCEKVNLKEDLKEIKRVLVKNQKNWELQELLGNPILNRRYIFEEKKDCVNLFSEVIVEQRIDRKVPIELEEEEIDIDKINKKTQTEND